MGTDKACKILHYYPEINSEWLLTGNGPMIKEEETSVVIMNRDRRTVDSIHMNQEIPLYDLEAVAGLRELFNSGEPQRVLDTIKIPNLPKCDGAISVTGDSMYPLLKSGDIVLYKETEFENIFFGEMYLLSVKLNDWEEYITVKYVQKSDQGGDYVKLVSQNSHHQPKDIHISKISALALIKASIRINTMM
ncbi:S24 family peptidase [Flavobacterium crocinum]|nr:S24 family peptidase [Flavobacterium crocinum]